MKAKTVIYPITVVILVIIIIIVTCPPGTDALRLTDNKYIEAAPIVTPDGQSVIFFRQVDTSKHVIQKKIDTGTPEKVILNTNTRKISPSLSNVKIIDGKSYYLYCYIDGAECEVHIVTIPLNLADSPVDNKITDMTSGSEPRAAWASRISVNGEHIVFMSTPPPVSWNTRRQWDIAYKSNDGVVGPGVKITNETTYDDKAVQNSPAISDGKKIIYIEYERVTPGDVENLDEIATWDIKYDSTPDDGSGGATSDIADLQQENWLLPTPLTPLAGERILSPREPLISANGELIVYNSRCKLYAIDMTGDVASPPRLIPTGSDLMVFDFNISQNGEWIVFSARKDLSSITHIYRIRSDGTGLRQVTSSLCEDHSPSINNEGNVIAFVRKTYMYNPLAWISNEIFVKKL